MIVCGLDEVGRGALAGPIVGAAVILNSKSKILNPKLRDSKKLNYKQREEANKLLFESGANIHVESISVNLINKYGIGWANKELFKRLISSINADKFIVDGNLMINIKGKNVVSLIKADDKVHEVMAASIVAKVTRDRIMKDLHWKYSEYGWVTNVGYGTKKHIQALRTFGVTKHHRDLFVRTALTQ